MKHEAPTIDYASLTVPPPTPTALSAPFWRAAAEGRLLLQRCAMCQQFAAYPREICPHCWSCAQEWHMVSGWGRLETFTRVHHAGNPGWQAAAPYVVALVRLAEGPVLLTQLLDSTSGPRAGARCRVEFTKVGAWTLPFFRLIDSGSES